MEIEKSNGGGVVPLIREHESQDYQESVSYQEESAAATYNELEVMRESFIERLAIALIEKGKLKGHIGDFQIFANQFNSNYILKPIKATIPAYYDTTI